MNLKSLGFLGFIIANLLPIQPGLANFPHPLLVCNFPKRLIEAHPRQQAGQELGESLVFWQMKT